MHKYSLFLVIGLNSWSLTTSLLAFRISISSTILAFQSSMIDSQVCSCHLRWTGAYDDSIWASLSGRKKKYKLQRGWPNLKLGFIPPSEHLHKAPRELLFKTDHNIPGSFREFSQCLAQASTTNALQICDTITVLDRHKTGTSFYSCIINSMHIKAP